MKLVFTFLIVIFLSLIQSFDISEPAEIAAFPIIEAKAPATDAHSKFQLINLLFFHITVILVQHHAIYLLPSMILYPLWYRHLFGLAY
jgi:hypothetical protein